MRNTFDYFDEEAYLAHYGVLGMKWGVRHDPQGAYTKAKKKLNKIGDRSDKAYDRSTRYTRKALHRRLGNNERDAHKARRAYQRARKNARKGGNWYKSMTKAFSKQSVVSIEPEVVRRGEQLLERYRNMTTANLSSI